MDLSFKSPKLYSLLPVSQWMKMKKFLIDR